VAWERLIIDPRRLADGGKPPIGDLSMHGRLADLLLIYDSSEQMLRPSFGPEGQI
jgi:hypothetical protein